MSQQPHKKSELFFKRFSVAENGYRIDTPEVLMKDWLTTDKLDPEPVLVANNGDGVLISEAFAHFGKALFRKFATLNPGQSMPLVNKDTITFANKYGFLGVGIAGVFNGKIVQVETLTRWSQEISSMAKVLEWWDKIQEKDIGWLQDRIVWVPNHQTNKLGVRHVSPENNGGEWIAIDGQLDSKLINSFTYGDVLAPAKLLVVKWINKQLKGSMSGALLFDLKTPGKPSIRLQPDSLLSFMWWQFALAVEGDFIYRTCRICGDPFRIIDKRQERKIFCTDACKSKNSRLKKKQNITID